MVKLPKCSILHTREVSITNCKDAPEYCTRTYHISLPKILCEERRLQKNIRKVSTEAYAEDNNANGDDENLFEGEYKKVGTIPMVFAFHGSGTDYKEMEGYSRSADNHHFVMILPEGINQSFNAGDCCGDAHELEIHDVDFIHQIKDLLNQEFDFLQHEYSYGIGWDNGGFLLTDATIESPHLFKAIVPIAGYSTRTWTPPSIGHGIGIMLHHSLDDLIMRPSGCCDDPNMPACQGGLVKENCDSVLDSFDLWARTVNNCPSIIEEGSVYDSDGTSKVRTGNEVTLLVGGGEGTFYSVEQEDGVTSMTYVSVADDKDEEPSSALTFSELPLEITYTHDNVVCLTTPPDSCMANSTLCLYKEMGHFEGFVSTPFMGDQVMEFLARDACNTNGGSLETVESSDTSSCKCNGIEFKGVYCLDQPGRGVILDVEETLQAAESLSTRSVSLDGLQISIFAIAGFTLLLAFTLVVRMRKSRMDKDGDHSTDKRNHMNRSIPSMSQSNRMPHDQLYIIKTNFEDSTIPRRSLGQGRGWKIWKKKEVSGGIPRRLSEGHLSDRDDRSCGLDNSDRSVDSAGSLKSLDVIDKQLLHFYRKKSSGSGSETITFHRDNLGGKSDDKMGLDLDKELLNTYRRRKMEREMYGEKRDEEERHQSDGESVHTVDSIDALNSFLFQNILTPDDLSGKGEQVGDNDDNEYDYDGINESKMSKTKNTDYIRSILWDSTIS